MGTIAPDDVNNIPLRHFFSMPVVNPFDSLTPMNPGQSTINGLPPGLQVGNGPGGFNFSFSHGHFIGSVDDMTNTLGPEEPLNSYLIWSSDGLNWDSYSIQGYTELTSAVASADTPAFGFNDYRLVLTDLDGKTQVSAVKRVWIGAAEKVVVREVGKQDFNGSSVRVPLNGFSTGVYYLLIRFKDGRVYRQTILHE